MSKYPKQITKAYICEDNDPDKATYLEILGVDISETVVENGKLYFQRQAQP
jgi:hypothetical protein